MSVLIATQHIHTTASKMVSRTYWPLIGPLLVVRASGIQLLVSPGSWFPARVIDVGSAGRRERQQRESGVLNCPGTMTGCFSDGSVPPLGLIFITQRAPLKAARPKVGP